MSTRYFQVSLMTHLLLACGGGSSGGSGPKEEMVVLPEIHQPHPSIDYSELSLVKYVDFEHHPAPLPYSEELFDADFNNHWQRIDGKARIIDIEGSNQLEVTIPAGLHQKGIWAGNDLNEHPSLCLSYQLQFLDNYDFSKGGKLPGLGALNFNLKSETGSQVTPTGCKKVGQQADEGFSLRLMFREKGQAFVYAYHQHNPVLSSAPEDERYCGEYMPLEFEGELFHFQRGVSYLIEECVTMNSAYQANGTFSVHINGHQVIQRSDMVFGESRLYAINQLFFHLWHGGSGSEWGPKYDSKVLLDNIALSEQPISHIPLK